MWAAAILTLLFLFATDFTTEGMKALEDRKYQEAADLFAKAVTWTWTQPRSVVTQRAFFETTRRLSAGVVVFEGRGSAQFRRLAVVAGVFTFKELGDS